MEELRSIELGETTSLALSAWKFRLFVRRLVGRDIFAITKERGLAAGFIRLCQRFNAYMKEQVPEVVMTTPREVALRKIRDELESRLQYRLVVIDEIRPWGAAYQIDSSQTDRFLAEFFSEVDLGKHDKLSPRLLVIYPGERLSFKYHQHRAEVWRFLTPGAYYLSDNDESGPMRVAHPDDIVEVRPNQRNRLCAPTTGYTIVAEVWRHTDPGKPSTEEDIVRLQDDYQR